MPELAEGQSIEIQGSAARPYVLKNLGGVYSCSCPAWRNQSLPIDRRTCKHLRSHCGDAAETARVGATGPAKCSRNPSKPTAPPLLLAETWNEDTDPTGWFLSELCGRPHNSLYVVALIMWRIRFTPLSSSHLFVSNAT